MREETILVTRLGRETVKRQNVFELPNDEISVVHMDIKQIDTNLYRVMIFSDFSRNESDFQIKKNCYTDLVNLIDEKDIDGEALGDITLQYFKVNRHLKYCEFHAYLRTY